ncbi:unnamed protein product [Lasius platythorax]|uniref:Uncharacterized protein n=1 Tax=Lasius platythorax TaxID=488582 RepID=A0AAV2MY21_9HYME
MKDASKQDSMQEAWISLSMVYDIHTYFAGAGDGVLTGDVRAGSLVGAGEASNLVEEEGAVDVTVDVGDIIVDADDEN